MFYFLQITKTLALTKDGGGEEEAKKLFKVDTQFGSNIGELGPLIITLQLITPLQLLPVEAASRPEPRQSQLIPPSFMRRAFTRLLQLSFAQACRDEMRSPSLAIPCSFAAENFAPRLLFCTADLTFVASLRLVRANKYG